MTSRDGTHQPLRTPRVGRAFVHTRVAAVFAIAAALAGAMVLTHTGTQHLRAAAILARASGLSGFLARRYDAPIVTETRTVASRGAPLRARLFRPAMRTAMPGIVLVHGIQCMGIDDARLIGLARSFAAAGFAVLTPEIPSLAQMRLSPESVDQVRDSVHALATEPFVRPHRVILIGASFAGGLALRAAADPATREQLASVVSVAGHHDLEHVLQYLAGIQPATSMAAHLPRPYPYGLEVFVLSYADRLVLPADVGPVRSALGAYLCAAPREGSVFASHASADGQALIDALLHDRTREVAPRIETMLPTIRNDMQAMSPAGHLAALGSLPVFILHGVDDDVIPVTEAEDDAHELSHDRNAHIVIQRAIQHVDIRPDASTWDRLRLVHVLAAILDTLS